MYDHLNSRAVKHFGGPRIFQTSCMIGAEKKNSGTSQLTGKIQEMKFIVELKKQHQVTCYSGKGMLFIFVICNNLRFMICVHRMAIFLSHLPIQS